MAEDEEALDIFRSVLAKRQGGSQVQGGVPNFEPAVGPTIYDQRIHDWSIRRRWLATAHCLGASYGQLATLERVTRASVAQAINKELPIAIRQSARLRTRINITELVHYWNVYGKHKDGLSKKSPQHAAQWLLENEPYEGEG
jgi:hypothetical protein